MRNDKPMTDDEIAYLRTQLGPQTPEYVHRLLARIEEDALKLKSVRPKPAPRKGPSV